MPGVESLIAGSQKLTIVFGYWPSFHDAEVLELHLFRGNVMPDKGMYEFPYLTLKVHLWAMTKEVDAAGYIVLRDHTLVTLKFTDVAEFEMEGFNHQNAMMSLSVTSEQRSQGPSPIFVITIAPAFGMGASFECLGMEVTDAVPCDEHGQPTPAS